jgi:YVTN family beta-propeller protein
LRSRNTEYRGVSSEVTHGLFLLIGCFLAAGCHEVHIQIERSSSETLEDAREDLDIITSPTDTLEERDSALGDAETEDGAFTEGRADLINDEMTLDWIEEEELEGIALNGPPPGGPFAYITNNLGNSVHVIDTSSHLVVAEIEVHDGPRGVAIHPNGHRVYIGNYGSSDVGDGRGTTVSVIDTHTNKVVEHIAGIPGPEGLEVHPDGSRLYVSAPGIHIVPPDRANDNVVVIDTENNQIISRIEVGDHPWGMELNHDGSLLYVANSHGESISIIDTQEEVVIQTVQVGDDGNTSSGEDYHISMIRLDPADESRLYAIFMHIDLIGVFDTETLELLETFTVWIHPHCMAFTPLGERLYLPAIFSDLLWVIDPMNNNEVEMTLMLPSGSRGVAVTPDGQWVYVTNGTDNTVSVLSAETNQLYHTIEVGQYPYAFGSFIYWPE